MLRFLRFGVSTSKEKSELKYWRGRYRTEQKRLNNDHYEYFYTSLFGLTREDYAGKRVLDIGCGPRGSLEWAVETLERVGLDPLADEYRKLGADKHQMKYVAAPSEKIPFPDGHFDIVTTFNSLDHVENVGNTVAEIVRVTRSGGTVLLIVEINHAPTPCEPHTLSRSILDQFATFETSQADLTRMRPGVHDIYGSLRDGVPENDPQAPAILRAKLRKQ